MTVNTLFPPDEEPGHGPLAVAFRSTDPLEASAVAAALEDSGLNPTTLEDAGAVMPGSLSVADRIGGAIPGFGGRPTLVLVPVQELAAARSCAQALVRASTGQRFVPLSTSGAVEGVGLRPTPNQKVLAWVQIIIAGLFALWALGGALSKLLR